MDPQHTFEKELTFSSVSDATTPTTLNHLHGRRRIVRASEVLLSLAGREINSGPPAAGGPPAAAAAAAATAVAENPGLESVHDVLRAFPPLTGEEGVSGSGSGKGDVQCPDCGAVFSSSYVFFLYHVMSCLSRFQWGQASWTRTDNCTEQSWRATT